MFVCKAYHFNRKHLYSVLTNKLLPSLPLDIMHTKKSKYADIFFSLFLYTKALINF